MGLSDGSDMRVIPRTPQNGAGPAIAVLPHSANLPWSTMHRTLLQRLVLRLVALGSSVFAVLLAVFIMLRLIPGDPVTAMLGEESRSADRAALTHCLRLDLPLHRQFAGFLGDIGSGTLGRYCDAPDKTVAHEILQVFPYTVALACSAFLLAATVGIGAGVWAARRAGSGVDLTLLSVGMIALSLPAFWVGPMLLLLFAQTLRFTPPPGDALLGWTDLIFPALAIAPAMAARLMRTTRSSMLDVLSAPFITAARARGVSGLRLSLKHALGAALVPVVSVAGLQLGGLLAGAIVVEKIFSRPGLGSLLLDGLFARNYPLVQGCVLVIALLFVLSNLLTDLVHAAVDPRMRSEGA